jgi:hypothetical protein
MKTLKDEADVTCADRRPAVLVQRRELGPVEPDTPGARLVQARE